MVRTDKRDAAILAEWRTDHYDKFFTRIKPSKEDMLNWLRNYESDDTDLMFLIEYPSGIPIGQMSLTKMDLNERVAEFGRIIHGGEKAPENIMQIASRTLIEWARNIFNLQRIYIEVFADNQRALNLYSKLGFHISEIQYFQRMITSEGIEQFVKIERRAFAKEKEQGRSVAKMILE